MKIQKRFFLIDDISFYTNVLFYILYTFFSIHLFFLLYYYVLYRILINSFTQVRPL